jgi:hypothetical protein
VPETEDERLASLPPTYAIMASTVESQGYVRRRRTTPSRRRQNAETQQQVLAQTGIDVIFTAFTHPLVNATPVITEDVEDEPHAQGRPPSETVSAEFAEATARAVAEETEDEGYQTAAVAPLVADDDDNGQDAPDFDDAGFYTLAKVIDGLGAAETVYDSSVPTPTVPTSSIQVSAEPSTSPDPGPTPIHSPQPETAFPPRSSEASTEHPHFRPPLPFRPTSQASSNESPAVQKRRAAAPRFSGGRDDDDDSDSEDSDDGEEFDSDTEVHDPRAPLNLPFFRPPKSTEPCADVYNRIQHVLEDFLDQLYPEFGTFLQVACHGPPGSIIDVPFLFIAIPTSETLPSINIFPASIKECGLGVVICHLQTSFSIAESTNRQLPRRHLCTGIEVGGRREYGTTLGAIIREPNGNYIGVTSGHLLDEGNLGDRITQPSYPQIDRQLATLSKSVDQYDASLARTKAAAMRTRITADKAAVERELQSVVEFVGPTENATWDNIKAGELCAWEWTTVKIGGERRIADYLLFDIERPRNPIESEIWEFKAPNEGILGDGNWERLQDWGKLEFDLQVRKNGMSTGFTFGVVAGITSSIRFLDSKKATREYYVLPETNLFTQPFARPGDSGAGVISRDGRLVGFVMAKTTLKNFSLAVLPNTDHLDVRMMARYRDPQDGSIDLSKVFFTTYPNLVATMVTCADVVNARTGIKAMGRLHLDC